MHPSVHLCVLEWQLPSIHGLRVEGWASKCVLFAELSAQPERQSGAG